jgi:hypothetical protein
MEVEPTVAPIVVNDTSAAPAPQTPASPQTPEAVAAPVQADLAAATDAAPAADVSPPPPAADAQPKLAAAEPVPDLLDKFDDKAKADAPVDAPKVEDKPAEAPKPEEKAAEAPKPDEAPPEPEKAPVEEPPKLDPIDWFAEEGGLKIPETLKLDDDTKPKLTAALETFRTDPTKGAQELIDLGNQAVTDAVTALHTQMWSDFSDTRRAWTEKVMADPELGGAGHETAMGRNARMRDMFVSRHAPETEAYKKDWAEFKEFMQVTGAGDHPAFHRMLQNVARKFDEATTPPPNPKPPADIGRKPGTKGKLNYTHPTSQPGN